MDGGDQGLSNNTKFITNHGGGGGTGENYWRNRGEITSLMVVVIYVGAVEVKVILIGPSKLTSSLVDEAEYFPTTSNLPVIYFDVTIYRERGGVRGALSV